MKKRILIVDDQPDFFSAIHEALSDFFEVVFVNTFKNALEMLQKIEFTAVISDLNLLEKSGLDLLNRVYEENPRIYRALMSGTEEKLVAGIAGYHEIVQCFIQKPLNIVKIIDLKNKIFNQPAPAV